MRNRQKTVSPSKFVDTNRIDFVTYWFSGDIKWIIISRRANKHLIWCRFDQIIDSVKMRGITARKWLYFGSYKTSQDETTLVLAVPEDIQGRRLSINVLTSDSKFRVRGPGRRDRRYCQADTTFNNNHIKWYKCCCRSNKALCSSDKLNSLVLSIRTYSR